MEREHLEKIGQRFQPGVGAGALKLVVQRAALVQHAVQDIGRNPPRREAGNFGRNCKS